MKNVDNRIDNIVVEAEKLRKQYHSETGYFDRMQIRKLLAAAEILVELSKESV